MSRNRNQNLELLRIVAAIFITFNHVRCSETALPSNVILKELFVCGGQFGVNLFVIIGCWFLVQVKPSIKRPIRVVTETCFYAVLFNIIAFATLKTHASFTNFLKGFHYWYPFGYVVMLILSPLLLKISEQNCKIISLIGGASFMITILGILMPNLKILTPFNKGIIIGPLWFCYVFLLIRSIKIVKAKKEYNIFTPRIYMAGFVITYLAMFLIVHKTGSLWIRHTISPLCIFSAYCLFCFFLAIKDLRHKDQINRIAKCTFVVYLFQCHANISEWLWNDFFHFYYWSEITNLWTVYLILATIFIFTVAIFSNSLLMYVLKIKSLLSRC